MAAKKKSPTKPKRKAGAVARVWQIATGMPKAERKDVLAACVKAGVNKSTAVTQYYAWKAATPAERQQRFQDWSSKTVRITPKQ
jgi:hypothetical protein